MRTVIADSQLRSRLPLVWGYEWIVGFAEVIGRHCDGVDCGGWELVFSEPV
jgi:hypothetical protein